MKKVSSTPTINLETKTIPMTKSEIEEFYKTIDWDWLFDYIRKKYGIGTKEAKPVPELKYAPQSCSYYVDLTWPDELSDKCGVLCDTFKSVKLTFFTSRFHKDVTYNKDIINEFIENHKYDISFDDCGATYGNKQFYAEIAFRIQLAENGRNYLSLCSAFFGEDGKWFILPEKHD